MKIITTLPLLTFMGFCNFEGADGFPDIENNRVAALFVGGVVIEGPIKGAQAVVPWMRPGASRPDFYGVYIRTLDNAQFKSTLDDYPVISLNHDPENPEHGPRYAEMRIENVHLTARRFRKHQKPQEDYRWNRSRMPTKNQIYITLPNGAIWESILEPHEANRRPASG